MCVCETIDLCTSILHTFMSPITCRHGRLISNRLFITYGIYFAGSCSNQERLISGLHLHLLHPWLSYIPGRREGTYYV